MAELGAGGRPDRPRGATVVPQQEPPLGSCARQSPPTSPSRQADAGVGPPPLLCPTPGWAVGASRVVLPRAVLGTAGSSSPADRRCDEVAGRRSGSIVQPALRSLLASSSGKQKHIDLSPMGARTGEGSQGPLRAGACPLWGRTPPSALSAAGGGGCGASRPFASVPTPLTLGSAPRFQLPEAPGAESLGVTATVLRMRPFEWPAAGPRGSPGVGCCVRGWRWSDTEDGTILVVQETGFRPL